MNTILLSAQIVDILEKNPDCKTNKAEVVKNILDEAVRPLRQEKYRLQEAFKKICTLTTAFDSKNETNNAVWHVANEAISGGAK